MTLVGTLTVVGAVAVVGALAVAPAHRVHAQAQATPKGQSPPAKDWPPGWTLYEPYPEELTFVVPQATTRVATGVRTFTSDITDEAKFKGSRTGRGCCA